MAYSDSIITIQRMAPLLQPLASGERSVQWSSEPGKARWLGYRIREALHCAQLHAASFPELAAAANEVRIEVLPPSCVLARPRQTTQAKVVAVGTPQRETQNYSVAAASDIMQIIEAWERRTADRLHLPSARLEPAALLELWRWAETEHLLLFESNGALTLVPFSEDVAEFAWQPQEEE